METTIDQIFEAATKKGSTIIPELDQINVTTIKNNRNQTLLHVAAGYGRTNLTIYLISRNVDVNAKDIEGQAPLHNACCHGHYTVARKLIEAGALVDIVDIQGWTPLHFALARKDNAEGISQIYLRVIDLLLESGANPYHKTTSGRNCLDRIKKGEDQRHVQVSFIVNKIKGCNEELREETIDRYLCAEDFFELVKIGDDIYHVIDQLATKRLIDSRLAFCDHITPLHRAAGYNHLDVARLFIEKNADVNASDSLGRIPLHNAAQYGHVKMIELLVNEKSNINKQDLIGYTALHVAASNRTLTACLTLIALGAKNDLKCHVGKMPYDLAESDSLKEILKPHRLEVMPSTSDHQAIYIDIQATRTQQQHEPERYSSLTDVLMLNSSSSNRLFDRTSHTLKKLILNESDWRFQRVKKRMLDTIETHNSESGGRYSSYDIISIELILNEKVWTRYKLRCQSIMTEHPKNEKLLFHGSNNVDNIQNLGFDEGYAKRNGMFGAGIYFAKHSSKSNQYTFGWGQGCLEHQDKSCYRCERKMIYAQVALGRCFESTEAMPDCAHTPPGYTSIFASPESHESGPDKLRYPEYVIYKGDQAYPLFLIRYKIKP